MVELISKFTILRRILEILAKYISLFCKILTSTLGLRSNVSVHVAEA